MMMITPLNLTAHRYEKKEPTIRVSKTNRPWLTDTGIDKDGQIRYWNCEYWHPKCIASLRGWKHLDKPEQNDSEIWFTYNGNEYYYKYDRFMTPKGLARKAFKILKELENDVH